MKTHLTFYLAVFCSALLQGCTCTSNNTRTPSISKQDALIIARDEATRRRGYDLDLFEPPTVHLHDGGANWLFIFKPKNREMLKPLVIIVGIKNDYIYVDAAPPSWYRFDKKRE